MASRAMSPSGVVQATLLRLCHQPSCGSLLVYLSLSLLGLNHRTTNSNTRGSAPDADGGRRRLRQPRAGATRGLRVGLYLRHHDEWAGPRHGRFEIWPGDVETVRSSAARNCYACFCVVSCCVVCGEYDGHRARDGRKRGLSLGSGACQGDARMQDRAFGRYGGHVRSQTRGW